MNSSASFRHKLNQGKVCLGVGISFNDPAVTEALSGSSDFVWIDMEHNPMSLDIVQAHLMAVKGTETTPLVRVRWNDPVLIKPLLDIGAPVIIVPMVRTAEEAARAIAACRYPPEGIRGYGPRRPGNYGRTAAAEYCRCANAEIMTILQIEHVDGVNNLDEILARPNVGSLVIGPMDLCASMGHTANPEHPEVLRAIDTIITKSVRAKVPVGIGGGDDLEQLVSWVGKGVRWVQIGNDFSLMLRSADQLSNAVRSRLSIQDTRVSR